MSFNWREYIKLAEDLIKNQTEASLRSSISRSYYGAFCIARNKKGYKEYKEKNIHWEVINGYKNSNKENEQKIGILLDALRKDRNKADYNEHENINVKIAQRSLEKSKKILEKFDITP